MKKKILVLGINCFPELTGIGKYTGEMVQWLAENGYETTLVTAPPYYPNWKVQSPYSGKWFHLEHYLGGKLTVYRCPLYVPSQPSGIKRMLHELSFFISAFLVVFFQLFKKKHDLIFAIAPPFHLGFIALFYRLFKGGKIIYHIQDLQIEAAKELGMLPSGLLNMLSKCERYLLRKVDVVSTISDGMMAKIRGKVSKPLAFFPNWVDTSKFYPLEDTGNLKRNWNYNTDDHVVLYSGSIGEKQGLESLVNVAARLRNNRRIKFLICGSGPYKKEIMRLADEEKLTNIRFLPLQDLAVFNSFLNMADVHLVLQKANASDLVMPSKLTTILAVGGLPIVTANPGTTLYEVISRHNMGILTEAENDKALADAILMSAHHDVNLLRFNARSYAEQFLDKDRILTKILYDLKP